MRIPAAVTARGAVSANSTTAATHLHKYTIFSAAPESATGTRLATANMPMTLVEGTDILGMMATLIVPAIEAETVAMILAWKWKGPIESCKGRRKVQLGRQTARPKRL